jgi:L-threonylcarbamoyladenylate synthase
MMTDVLQATHPQALERAQQVLRRGGLIAFPTDTVYGLGAEVLNAEAVSRLYRVKGRTQEKAIPVLAANKEDVLKVAQSLPEMARRLADRFWPGPLTLVVLRLAELPQELSVYETVGVRIPDHEMTLELLEATGPLAVTSANLAGDPSSLSAADVLAALDGEIDLLLDGGLAPGGMPSTVVDCTQDQPQVLRPGPISAEDIAAALE